MDPDAVRGQVAEIAVARFASFGYACTTLEDIARAAGTTAAELRELFGDKEGLIAELVRPLVDRLLELAMAAAGVDLRKPEQIRALVADYLDALTMYRPLVAVLTGDSAAASSVAVRSYRAALGRVRDRLAGEAGTDVDRMIRASAALGAVQATVLDLGDIDPGVLREVLIDAAVAILLT